MKLKGKVVFLNVPADDPAKVAKFYSDLLGIELVESLSDTDESYHAPVSPDGIDINVNKKHAPEEKTSVYYGVSNLDAAVQKATQGGARVVWGPSELKVAGEAADEYKALVAKEFPGDGPVDDKMGRVALLVDPGGNSFGLVQLAGHTHGHFKVGKHYQPLDAKQDRIHGESMRLSKALSPKIRAKRPK